MRTQPFGLRQSGCFRAWVTAGAGVALLLALLPSPAAAAETLCDTAYQDCRTPLINLIRNEKVGIDVAFWFMKDARYPAELQKRLDAGVPVRVLMDPRANATEATNADRLSELASAGIPMRKRVANGILHWKMMLFAGQNTVMFTAGNFSSAFVPDSPYTNYTDEVLYFSDDPAVVDSFKTKYDDSWVDTTHFANYANVNGPLVRTYPTFSIDPDLNFPPEDSYRKRAVSRYDAEKTGIDVTMYRITDAAHADAMIRAVARGVPVRLLIEQEEYRNRSRLWDAYNVDRMYHAGVQIRQRAHIGLLHQKSVVLRSQGMVIFGSSNWTSPSTNSQQEHNYFTTKPWFYQWFVDQFDRKWNNSTGNKETKPFTPLPSGTPAYISPANGATGQDTASVTLTWNGGLWAHIYDVYFGTSAKPALLAQNLMLGPSENGKLKTYTITGLQPGTTYYWQIVSKTMAYVEKPGPIDSFTTSGSGGIPDINGVSGPGDVVLYASTASPVTGDWTVEPDSTAAGGRKILEPNTGRSKVSTASAQPADAFELKFTADAGKPYRLWLRLRAQSNFWGNDSVHVQFSDSVTSSGSAAYRIGTTSSAEVNLEDCSGCGLQGWGWQDDGWGVGVLGPAIYFATTGTHTIRIQRREDGVWIDQIMLSPQKYLTASPGKLKNDATVYAESTGGASPPPDGDVVLYAKGAPTIVGNWVVTADPSAAGGARIWNEDRDAPKVQTALANPLDYFEMSFTAKAGTPYRLWLRSEAENNDYDNDSVHVQFSDSVDADGDAAFRIGSTDSAPVVLEDCHGCGDHGWGWQDDGYGAGALGPLIYFAAAGTHDVRIQVREDGISIDQIVLSPSTYLNSSPGALKDDTTILPANSGQS
ncbi:MAG TPA: phospholipase D-like domain-containing protein [Vicinamibacterales bacterium]|nr:phospholipase D-like domain-containing protein [Vicinamibacterales bacterium]